MTIRFASYRNIKTNDLKNFKMINETRILDNNLPVPTFVKKIFEKLH